MSDTHHEPITKRYGGLLLATCKEVVDECSHVRDPTEQDIEYMVGWVMVESDWHANPEAAKDCIEELVEAGGEIDG